MPKCTTNLDSVAKRPLVGGHNAYGPFQTWIRAVSDYVVTLVTSVVSIVTGSFRFLFPFERGSVAPNGFYSAKP